MANNGVYFDGTNDYMTQGEPGVSDNSVVSEFIWFKPDSGLSSFPYRVRFANSGRWRIEIDSVSGGKYAVVFAATDASNNATFSIRTTYSITPGEWNLVFMSYDGVNAVAQLLDHDGNDIDDTGYGSRTLNVNDIAHNQSNSVGALVGGGTKYPGALGPYWRTNELVDWSQQSNRDKVITAVGKPNLAGIGSDGSGITGTQALWYLRDPFGSYETNSGSAGDFTVNGALTDEGTEPILPGYVVAGSSGLLGVGI